MLQPALLGGVVIGVLSALPLVNLVNICCCGWVLFGGGLSAYLLQQQRPGPISVGDGAIAGLLAGVFGAVVLAVVSIPLNMMMAPFQAGMLEDALTSARDLPPEARAFFESLTSGAALGAASVFAFLVSLVVFSVFGFFGGLFGALIFKKNAPPPPPPPEVPTFTPPTFTPPPPPSSWNPPPPPPTAGA
jgi:hypothetical protein